MGVLSELQPSEVWRYFEEICAVPRPSKNEGRMTEYLKEFGIRHKLNTKVDSLGNVLICKPATPGMEDRATIILQSHIDMVCEKDSGVDFDFATDAIRPYVDGEWVKARGTTLGADDGIGVAAALAVLASTTIEHGHVECLFTVDEETGLTGALGLEPGFFSGKILLNLDSEDEGELFIGCAGGVDTVATFTYKEKSAPAHSESYRLRVSGLRGGHSGDDINKGLGNANKIAARFMLAAAERFEARLHQLQGGNLRNAIAREAEASFAVHNEHAQAVERFAADFARDVRDELRATEPNLKIELERRDPVPFVVNKKAQWNLLRALHGVWHGVVEMSRDIPGLVETSTNLASVKFGADGIIEVTTSQRSSVESQKEAVARTVASVFELAEATVAHTDGYPGWKPDTASPILAVARQAYADMFGVEPVVRAIHAGLECGLFLEKYPGLDMISFGPTLRDVHSPSERINIESTVKFWAYLLEILRRAPKK